MNEQPDLFGLTPVQQVESPTPGPFRRDNPVTSKRAAQHVAIKTGALKHRILLHLFAMGGHGANDWELHVACDPKGRVHSAATRRKELMDDFEPPLVRTTAHIRPTDDPSNGGLVHVLTDAGAAVLEQLESSRAA